MTQTSDSRIRGVPRRLLRPLKWLYLLQQRCLYQWNVPKTHKLPWDQFDAELVRTFLTPTVAEGERYAALFAYLVTGLHHYGSPDHAYVYYPGASNGQSAQLNALEGFCRSLPMIAAWVSSGRPAVITGCDGTHIDLVQLVQMGVLAGTDPRSGSFWGCIRDYDQRMVEAADVALALWLLRDHLWSRLDTPECEQVCSWLAGASGKAVYDNNWHLFPVVIEHVLSALGQHTDKTTALGHYQRFKSFYAGDGWFSDGQKGQFDYYNAWGMHYPLYWINQIAPTFDPEFIDGSLNDFVATYKYFFSPQGLPILGRSVCYRMAAPAPLVAAAARRLGSITSGMARRALDCVWEYFISRGALQHGTITQGYWGKDLRLLDNYSGPGSGLWSTRSLAVAFYLSPEAPFWAMPLESLPIETQDYRVPLPGPGWEISGCQATQEVCINTQNPVDPHADSARGVSVLRSLLSDRLGLPARRPSRLRPYGRRTYSSLTPFWLVDDADIGR